jgi:hypothetical protein
MKPYKTRVIIAIFLVRLGFQTFSSQTFAATVHQLTTSEHQFLAGVDNQGWWADSIYTTTTNNDNYLCGLLEGTTAGHTRSFFTFYVPAWSPSETVVSAILSAPRGGSLHANSPSVELQLFDVTTPAATLNNNLGTNVAIFGDLGTGINYGSAVVSGTGTASQPVQVPLNAQGIAALNGSLPGTYFSIGARLADESNRIFLDSGDYTVSLIVTTVPEPSTALLVVSIFALLAARRKAVC